MGEFYAPPGLVRRPAGWAAATWKYRPEARFCPEALDSAQLMRSPEAARALPELVAAGVVTPAEAAPLLAAAKGELVSVRAELRALLALGVAALTAGVGLFLKEHHEEIGPLTIALLLTFAAAACLWAVWRRAPAFTWAKPPEADWIVDGLLLLAVGLIGADLAWIETQFTPLGAAWPWHLFWMSLVTAALAIRFDSIAAWSLALTTFAAWRGVSVMPDPGRFERSLWANQEVLRFNLLVCAALFVVVGYALVRSDRKAHFEPVSTFLGVLAAGLAFASGLGVASVWPLWSVALAVLGLGVTRFAFVKRRLTLFALGALGVYAGVTRFLVEIPGAAYFGCFWFAGTTVGAIALLILVHRRFRAAEAGA